MESGYVVVRDMIDPDELRELRTSVDLILGRVPEPQRTSRVTTTDWVERESADAVEFCFDDRTLEFSRHLMKAPAAAPLGMWVLCAAGTGWHRDIPSLDMPPLDGLQEDLSHNGPPYLQWNVALYDDSFLHVIPGSHLRRNNAEERKTERRLGVVPLPGTTAVDLQAGDGVVYINQILHSAKPSGDTKRRTFHMGYQAFGNESFTHYFPDSIGLDFIEHLSSRGADRCRQFERLHAQWHDEIATTLGAIIRRERGAFIEAFETLHSGEHGKTTSLIALSKIAYKIRKYKGSDSDDSRNTKAVQDLAGRFTAEELDQLWDRFG